MLGLSIEMSLGFCGLPGNATLSSSTPFSIYGSHQLQWISASTAGYGAVKW